MPTNTIIVVGTEIPLKSGVFVFFVFEAMIALFESTVNPLFNSDCLLQLITAYFSLLSSYV